MRIVQLAGLQAPTEPHSKMVTTPPARRKQLYGELALNGLIRAADNA